MEARSRKQKNKSPQNFFLKRFAWGTLCTLMLSVVLSACSHSPNYGDNTNKIRKVFTVKIIPSKTTLTPIIHGGYSERSTTFSVMVSGFKNRDDVNSTWLGFTPQAGLSSVEVVEDTATESTRSFVVSVHYNGTDEFPSGAASIRLHLNVPKGYADDNETLSTQVSIRDGLTKNNPIPVNADNIEHFNHYANTSAGLARHYQLTETFTLPPKSPGNWTAIGRYFPDTPNPFAEAFIGSFDGNGHSISGLTIASGNNFQGMFGIISKGAEIKNLGLKNVHVTGVAAVGGLLGASDSDGTVHNCYVTGKVTGDGIVGGLIGMNDGGMVHDCYSTANVSTRGGNGNHVGGVVGQNNGTVHNCYATGSVLGFLVTGGVVGANGGTVQNCVALNSSVKQTYTEPNGLLGRVVGSNRGTKAKLSNNYARGNMLIRYRVDANGNGGTNQNTTDTAALNQVDGESVSAAHCMLAPFWEESMRWDFSENGSWQWDSDSSLPILKKGSGI